MRTTSQHMIARLMLVLAVLALSLLTPALAQKQRTLKDNDLIEAAREGNLYGIIMAMDSGMSVNDRGRYRIPPIVVAAEAGQLEAVRLLLQKGAQIDMRAQDNLTALGAAISRDRADIVKVLLDAGADPNRLSADNEAPLIIAARAGSTVIVSLLLSAGADRYETDRTGRTALDWAQEKRFGQLISLLNKSEK
jgi:ankyrin repeat protein